MLRRFDVDDLENKERDDGVWKKVDRGGEGNGWGYPE